MSGTLTWVLPIYVRRAVDDRIAPIIDTYEQRQAKPPKVTPTQDPASLLESIYMQGFLDGSDADSAEDLEEKFHQFMRRFYDDSDTSDDTDSDQIH